jgi:hypothetical protein
LLAEIHGGECESHSSSRTLVGKAVRHGFYWPTALQDAAELVLQSVSVPCKADTHSSSGTADDSSLLAFCCVGVGYLRIFS